MENVLVKGHKVIQQPGDSEQSTLCYPINADYAFTGQITAYNATNGEVQLESIWDEAAIKETFFALAKYIGQPGIPLASEVVVGQFCAVYRSGEVNQPGPHSGLAIRDTAAGLASFVAFFFTA